MRCLTLLLIAAAAQCFALDPSQPASSYIQTTFTVEDGLPSNNVNAIVQTRNGFLWVGTEAGLARFNGRRFTLVNFRRPGSSPRIVIRSLAEAQNGDLWVGTDIGLARIPHSALDDIENAQASFYHPGDGTGDQILCLRLSRSGVLWVGTNRGVYRYQNRAFVLVLPDLYVVRLEESFNSHILIVTNHGFVEWDGQRMVEHPGLSAQLGVRDDQLFHVMEDHNHIRWFCTRAGIARYANGAFRRLPPYGGDTEAAYRAIEDAQGNIWVFTQTGIARATAAGLESLAPGMRAACAYSDRDGRLWIGRKGDGLVRVKDRLVSMLIPLKLRATTHPTAVLTSWNGKLWIGNSCGGVSLFDGQTFKTYNEKDGLLNSCVVSLAESPNHDLWIGTWGGGLFRFNDGKFTQYSTPQGLPSNVVHAIFPAPGGSLWVATENGLAHMLNEKFRTYSVEDGLSSDHISNVYGDRHGEIWVATKKGIDRMTGDRFTSLSSAPDIADNQSIGFGEDFFGSLYVVSAPIGVRRIENHQLIGVHPDLNVLSMLEFNRREFWLTGNNGIFRLPADEFARADDDPQSPVGYERLDRSDGLTTPQCSFGIPNMAVTPDGKLWVATAQGLAVLDLLRFPRRNLQARIFADEVTVGRVKKAAGRELLLPPGTNHVEIQFDAIELGSPEKIRFQYRLDGVDGDWLNADSTRTAVYNSVPVGAHSFHFRACNSDGVWDKAGTTYTVRQQPYYYQTKTFIAAFVVLLLLAFTAMYFLRLRQVTLQIKGRLEERLDERERIARDLHDTLLQSVQGMILRFQAVSTQIPSAEPARRMMEDCLGRADQVLIEGRDRITTLRAQVERGGDLIQSLVNVSEEFGRTSSMEFSLLVTGNLRALHAIVRDEAYWIGREALLNALYHSEARKVETEIIFSSTSLNLRFRDDGIGMEPVIEAAYKPRHWGLVGMRERADKLGAKPAIHSRPGAGTEIDLAIPASIAYGGYLNVFPWKWLLPLIPGRRSAVTLTPED